MTDPISDMLTQLRNALAIKRQEVLLPYSKFKENLARIFEKQGWLEKVEIVEKDKFKYLKLGLRYDGGVAAISGLKRVSKPGQRIYAKVSKIPRVSFGVGYTIVSTPRGLMTDQEARKQKLGGEVICQVW